MDFGFSITFQLPWKIEEAPVGDERVGKGGALRKSLQVWDRYRFLSFRGREVWFLTLISSSYKDWGTWMGTGSRDKYTGTRWVSFLGFRDFDRRGIQLCYWFISIRKMKAPRGGGRSESVEFEIDIVSWIFVVLNSFLTLHSSYHGNWDMCGEGRAGRELRVCRKKFVELRCVNIIPWGFEVVEFGFSIAF